MIRAESPAARGGLNAIDTLTNQVIATVPIGQAPRAVVYVPNGVPDGDGTQNKQRLGLAGESAHLSIVQVVASQTTDPAPTSVALFDQGLPQVLQESATGMQPKSPICI
jgi:DNA-binding beta-propeller fold protein YncE